jgi:hypothetical protein
VTSCMWRQAGLARCDAVTRYLSGLLRSGLEVASPGFGERWRSPTRAGYFSQRSASKPWTGLAEGRQ